VIPTTERVIVRELKCFLCGYTLGEVVGNALHHIFRRAPDCPPLLESRLSRLRCPRCKGPVFLDGAESTLSWTTPPVRPAGGPRRS
jgi:hypothetical protein